jgi:hypothetical protein
MDATELRGKTPDQLREELSNLKRSLQPAFSAGDWLMENTVCALSNALLHVLKPSSTKWRLRLRVGRKVHDDKTEA